MPETCLSLRDKPAYEAKKHDGSFPVIGVNTFQNPHGQAVPQEITQALFEVGGQYRRST